MTIAIFVNVICFPKPTILFLGCNGESKNTDTGETKIDADGDGVFADIDCDDSNPNVSSLETFYQDNDGDGLTDEKRDNEATVKVGPTDGITDIDAFLDYYKLNLEDLKKFRNKFFGATILKIYQINFLKFKVLVLILS